MTTLNVLGGALEPESPPQIPFAAGVSRFYFSNSISSFSSPPGYFPGGRVIELGSISFFLYSLFLILASANAFNIADGLDGLSAGCGILTFSFWMVVFLLQGDYSLAQVAVIFSGALLSFLWFNFWPTPDFHGGLWFLIVRGSYGSSGSFFWLFLVIGPGWYSLCSGYSFGDSSGVFLPGVWKKNISYESSPSSF